MRTLDLLSLNESSYIKEINTDNNLKNRLFDLGFITNQKITCICNSPAKNPRAYIVMNSVIPLRNEDAKKIIIEGDKDGTY